MKGWLIVIVIASLGLNVFMGFSLYRTSGMTLDDRGEKLELLIGKYLKG